MCSTVQRLRARKASLAELQSVHSENHVKLYGRPTQRKPGQERKGTLSWEQERERRNFLPLL